MISKETSLKFKYKGLIENGYNIKGNLGKNTYILPLLFSTVYDVEEELEQIAMAIMM